MATFADMVKARDEQAAQWIKDNAEAMREERDSGYSNSHEVSSGTGETEYASERLSPYTLLAQLEIGQGYWEDSVQEDSMLEACGSYDVTSKAAWRGKCTSYENVDSEGVFAFRTGNRGIFVQEAFDKANVLAAKKAAVWGIEECISPKKVNTRKLTSAEKSLKRLQKQAAIREQARAAKAARQA